ncbi:hypothetical protein BDA96_01G243100 [Sorghum bicolor]|uniref:Uncharacterized protein n=2 Tax=Sorghum bicolor TaxID=4558 RepID=A0A921UZ64_SORBI|nr:hypothetical protein BDA96_01G243100 [Sorghum bicolor]OQU91686.1 hypothetical protein SORBI_3001G228701 [Sorghum bicolor]
MQHISNPKMMHDAALTSLDFGRYKVVTQVFLILLLTHKNDA